MSQILVAALWALPAAAAGFPAEPSAEAGMHGCCRHDGEEASRLLKSAERYYAEFRPKEAATELHKILRFDPRNFEALIRLARAYIDIGDQIEEQGADWKERKLKEYRNAEEYARRAVKIDGNSTWSHFWLAAALGNIAMVSSTSKQIELAGEIRDTVERSIALDPKNGSAYHIYGVWHRKVAQIGATRRMFASVIFGRSPPHGSLEKSVDFLKTAVALNPIVIVSRLELARSYMVKEEWAAARAQLKSIAELPIQFSDDAKHKQQAVQLLAEIKDR